MAQRVAQGIGVEGWALSCQVTLPFGPSVARSKKHETRHLLANAWRLSLSRAAQSGSFSSLLMPCRVCSCCLTQITGAEELANATPARNMSGTMSRTRRLSSLLHLLCSLRSRQPIQCGRYHGLTGAGCKLAVSATVGLTNTALRVVCLRCWSLSSAGTEARAPNKSTKNTRLSETSEGLYTLQTWTRARPE